MRPVATRRAITVIGLGLIGGSLGLALRRRGWRVTGVDRSAAARGAALRRGAAHRVTASVREGVTGADVVAVCVPVQAMDRVLRDVGAAAGPRTVVTDACSVKAAVLRTAGRCLPPGLTFVGAHPMAGSEQSGMAAARANLFQGRACVITPGARANPAATRMVWNLWRDAGARPIRMSAGAHDHAVALTSHLPHLIAFALIASLRGTAGARRLVAGSFQDATRVARSNPALWAGILAANRTEVARALAALGRTAGRLLQHPGAGLRRATTVLRGHHR